MKTDTRGARLAVLFAISALGCSDAAVTEPATASSSGDTLSCDASAAGGVDVAAEDYYGGEPYALGYPPYALHGCNLVYVSPPEEGQTYGRLVLRDLVDNAEVVLAGPEEGARRPAIADSLIVWEATIDGRRVVRVRAGEAPPIEIDGPFAAAGEPRVTADAVVFTAWKTDDEAGDTDVLLWSAADGSLLEVGTGPAQQRFADVSADHVAWTDFSEDPDGSFGDDGGDVAEILVMDRANRNVVTRQRPGKQAFPMLDGGKVGFLDWGFVHPEPKFSEYELFVGDVSSPETDALVAHVLTHSPYVRPAASGGVLEWISDPEVESIDLSLWRRPMDLSTEAARVEGIAGEIYTPAASTHFSVVGQLGLVGNMVLIAAER